MDVQIRMVLVVFVFQGFEGEDFIEDLSGNQIFGMDESGAGSCRWMVYVGVLLLVIRWLLCGGVVAETFEHKNWQYALWIGYERVRRSSADDLGAHEYLMERLCRGWLCSKVSRRYKSSMFQGF